jgi:hypothetical protein
MPLMALPTLTDRAGLLIDGFTQPGIVPGERFRQTTSTRGYVAVKRVPFSCVETNEIAPFR